MAEEKPPTPQVGIAKVSTVATAASMREMIGPLMVDQVIRQAIQQCWMSLPEDERSPERVEQEILRLVHRALQEMREDAAAFGFVKEERLARIRGQYPKAYEKWTDEDDTVLTQKFGEGASIVELAKLFQRQPSAIRSRLAKLGLL